MSGSTTTTASTRASDRRVVAWLWDYALFPVLVLPVCVIWLILARLISFITPFFILPAYLICRPFYWAVPLARAAFDTQHSVWVRWGFEGTYAMNIVRRFMTLPLRRNVPDIYILGFPKCGTTALAQYLMQHPAISGIDGLPYDPSLSKESHFFNGVLGANHAYSRTMYRSFFPTIVTRWWCEVVKRCGTWMVMDACPLSACLPYVAERIKRISPDAKLIFMVRNPADSCFSGEIMIRNTGIDLDWSYTEPSTAAQGSDPRFSISPEDAAYFQRLERLGPEESLPEDMPRRIYTSPSSYLYFSDFAARLTPYLERFPRENIMVLEMKEFYKDTERHVRDVLEFVGADLNMYTYQEVAMWSGERRGRRMHASVRARLDTYFREKNEALFGMVGKRYAWDDQATEGESEVGERPVVLDMPPAADEEGRGRVQRTVSETRKRRTTYDVSARTAINV